MIWTKPGWSPRAASTLATMSSLRRWLLAMCSMVTPVVLANSVARSRTRTLAAEPMSDRTSTLTTGQKSPSNPEVGPRLVELLDRCGIAAAHFASRGTADLKGLLSQQPERVASLTVLCPAALDTRTLARIGERLLVVTGDRGPGARRVQAGLPDLPRATAMVLDDYAGLTWSDIAAERGDGIVAAIRG